MMLHDPYPAGRFSVGTVSMASAGSLVDHEAWKDLTRALSIRILRCQSAQEMTEAALSLANLMVQAHGAPADDSCVGLLPFRLRRALAYLDEHYREPELCLQTVADVVGLSTGHLLRMFKKSMGVTPHIYVRLKRIQKAMELLRESDLSLVNVALELGFPNQSHFSTIFKKVTGTTPKVYREFGAETTLVSQHTAA